MTVDINWSEQSWSIFGYGVLAGAVGMLLLFVGLLVLSGNGIWLVDLVAPKRSDIYEELQVDADAARAAMNEVAGQAYRNILIEGDARSRWQQLRDNMRE